MLSISLAALLGGAATVAPGPVAVVGMAAFWCLRSRLSAWALAALVAALSVGAVRARCAVQDYESRRATAHAELGVPSRCAGRGEVVRSPTLGRGLIAYVAAFERLDCEGRIVHGPVRVRLYGGPHELTRGDVVHVTAQLATARLFRNADLADPTPGAARRGPVLSGSALAVHVTERASGLAAWIDRARHHARRRIDASFAPAAAPMARALVLGENDLDPRDDEAFRRSGLAHLLAVSGTHLVFAVVAVVRALAFLLVRIEWLAAGRDVQRLAAAAGAVLALLYADFAGGSGSAWRAAWMLAAAFAAQAFGRRPTAARSVAASIGIGVVIDPLCAFDISFLLSAAATAGLIVLGQPLAARFRGLRSRVAQYLVTSIIATVTSMIPCAPLLALLAPELTIAGILANVVAAPLGEVVALPLCLAHTLTSWLPELERGAALVASGALLVVKRVAHASASAEALQVLVPPPSGWHFAVLGVGALLMVVARSRWWGAGAVGLTIVGLAIVEAAAIRHGTPTGTLRVTAVDVGQGDCTLVDLPDGKLMLVDAGGFVGSPVDPGKSVLRPLLRERRRKRVDIVVLSHPHPDHFGGLESGLHGIEIGEFWDSGQGEAEGAGPVYRSLLAELRRRGTPIRRPRELCDKTRWFSGARVDLLGPCPTFRPRINANDNSLVLRIRFGTRAVLLTGDAEREQEEKLIGEYGDELRSDFLKVGHHGSKTSTSSEFLRHVRPRLATMSCGVRNRFGHPHPNAMAALAAAGVTALRLDQTGSITWVTDGSRESLELFARAWPHR